VGRPGREGGPVGRGEEGGESREETPPPTTVVVVDDAEGGGPTGRSRVETISSDEGADKGKGMVVSESMVGKG